MNAQEALNLIAQRAVTNNPMSVEELRNLANSVDATISGNALILYSGKIGDTSTYAAWKVADALAASSSIDPVTGAHTVSTISDTQIANLLESNTFRVALDDAIDLEGPNSPYHNLTDLPPENVASMR